MCSREYMIIYHGCSAMLVHRWLGEDMGLRDGQSIDTPTFWRVIAENVAATKAAIYTDMARDASNG